MTALRESITGTADCTQKAQLLIWLILHCIYLKTNFDTYLDEQLVLLRQKRFLWLLSERLGLN